MLTKTTYSVCTLIGAPQGTAQVKAFSYPTTGWKDVLAGVNSTTFSHDDGGNLLNYNGFNFTWQNGKELKTVGVNNATPAISYAYDEAGIRTSKTVNGVTIDYTIVDNKVTSQSDGTNKLYFFYDSDNNPTAFAMDGDMYHYMTNLQGVITGILDASGIIVVKYAYDAWGGLIKVTDGSDVEQTSTTFIGNINPFRYKGYYYDTETSFYYLQSRYYDPAFGRFINADNTNVLPFTQGQLLGANLFVYCGNNPVINNDYNGKEGSGFLIKDDSVGYVVKLIQDKLNANGILSNAIRETGQVNDSTIANDGSYGENVGKLIAVFTNLVGIIKPKTIDSLTNITPTSSNVYDAFYLAVPLRNAGNTGSIQYNLTSITSTTTTTETTYSQTPEIVNGAVYYIKNKSSGRYIYVNGGGTTQGTRVWQYDYIGGSNQKWKVEFSSSTGTYLFHPMNAPNMNLDVLSSCDKVNAPIGIANYKDNGSPYTSSRWYIKNNLESIGEHSFTILSCNAFALTKPFASNANNPLTQFTPKSSDNSDNWIFIPAQASGIANGGIYFIKNKKSLKYIDVTNAQTDAGTRVQHTYFNGCSAQQWKIEYLSSEGLYLIQPLLTYYDYPDTNIKKQFTLNLGVIPNLFDVNKVNLGIGILNNNLSNGQYGPGLSSKWLIKYNYDGTYTFFSKASNFAYTLTKDIIHDTPGNLTQYLPQLTSNAIDNSDNWVFEQCTIPDYSVKLNQLVQTNATECIDHRIGPQESSTGYGYWIANVYVQLDWFRGMVGHGDPWDLKVPLRWNQQLPDLPYLDVKGKFYWNGYLTDAEEAGNITYGVWGSAVGFGDKTLYWGGGFANQGEYNIETRTPPYYGDNQDDHWMIKKGIDWFNNSNPNLHAAYNEIPLP